MKLNSQESAASFLDELLFLRGQPSEIVALARAEREGTRNRLYVRAKALLGAIAPVEKVLLLGGSAETRAAVRELALPYVSGAGACELVLANTFGNNPYSVDSHSVSLYIRQPAYQQQDTETTFQPGRQLFHLHNFGLLEVPEGDPDIDPEIVDGMLCMFEAEYPAP